MVSTLFQKLIWSSFRKIFGEGQELTKSLRLICERSEHLPIISFEWRFQSDTLEQIQYQLEESKYQLEQLWEKTCSRGPEFFLKFETEGWSLQIFWDH